MLVQTVESVLAQDFDLSQVEVIIVTQNQDFDNGILPASETATITVIQRPEGDTISALRNFGAGQSSGDYLAFLDADVQLSPNWITSMQSELAANDRRLLISAVQRCEDNAPILEKVRTILSLSLIHI